MHRIRMLPSFGLTFSVVMTVRLYLRKTKAVFRDGLAISHARIYRREHGLEGCTAFNPYEAICDIADAFVMDDDLPELFNTHGFERLARWGTGYLKVYGHCRTEKDWRGEKKQLKTQWELMPRYHPTAADHTVVHADEAEEEVVGMMKEDAVFHKYLSKAEVEPQ